MQATDRPTLPCVAVTMGDPAGIGPELCLALLRSQTILDVCTPLVFGNADVLRLLADRIGVPAPREIISIGQFRDEPARRAAPAVVHFPEPALPEISPGSISALTGTAAYAYIDAAIEEAVAGRVAAVTTAPINKEALSLAGIRFPGHTEIFAARTAAPRSCMMQYSEEITCTFVTVHVGYAEVPGLLSESRIRDVIDLTAEALLRIRGRAPKILVCGLNPHAGETGLFGGGEEERCIVPAISSARAAGLDVHGPVPADTAFIPARLREYDAVVCMYHDQGHIPVKALAFDSAVNTTLGLPIIRTSVDHGTALDIAGKGVASTGSLFAAVRLAVRLAAQS